MYTSALSAGLYNKNLSQNSLSGRSSNNNLTVELVSASSSSFVSLNLDGYQISIVEPYRKISTQSARYEQHKPCRKGHSHVYVKIQKEPYFSSKINF